MNTTTRFFQDKAQYKAFRKAFAAAFNDKRNRKVYTVSTRDVWDPETEKTKQITYKYKTDGWLHSGHFMLFNIVCGRDFHSGFTPKLKPIYITSGGNPDRGLQFAVSVIENVVTSARAILGGNKITVPSYIKDTNKYVADQTARWQNAVNSFLEPFDGTITLADLARIEIPKFKRPYTPNAEIIDKKLSYQQLLNQPIEVVQEVQQVSAATIEPKKSWIGKARTMFGGK